MSWKSPNIRCIYTYVSTRVGQDHIYGVFGLEITKCAVYIYVYIRFWPTLKVTRLCLAFYFTIGTHISVVYMLKAHASKPNPVVYMLKAHALKPHLCGIHA